MNTTAMPRTTRHRSARRTLLAAGIVGLLTLLAGAVEAKPQPFRSPSKSIETTSDMVSLPTPGGTVVIARGCDTCDPVSLSLVAGTEYWIGTRSVTFAEFRDRARSGVHDLSVHYHRTTFEVLKIRLGASN